MSALPSFTVTGNLFDLLGNVVGSELSANGFGSGVAGGSKVTFTPNVPKNQFVTWDGKLHRVDPVVAQVAADGHLHRNGDTVRLLANDGGLSIDNLQWQVTVAGMKPFWFDAPVDGATVNLQTVAPVPNAPVVGIVNIPDGVQLNEDGDVQFTVGGNPLGDPLDLDVAVWPEFNVKNYGPSTHTTVTALVAAMPSTGGTLYFPSGAYTFGAAVEVDKPLRIRCDPGAVIRMTAKVPALAISDTSDVTIEGLTFDGDRDTLGAGVYDLIELEDVTDVRVRGCKFLDSSSGGIKITRGSSIWITGNRLSNLYNAGVALRDPGVGNFTEDIWITGNFFDRTQQGGFDGNAAIESNHTSELSYRSIHVLNNIVRRPEIVGIGLDSLSTSTIHGNIIIKDGTCSPGEALGFTGSDVVVSENYCHNDSSSSGGALLFWATADLPCEHNQIVNNRCTNGGQGIAIVFSQNGTDINNLLIQGNHCYGSDYGIQSWLQPGVTTGSQTGIVVSNNDVTGNTTAALSLVPVGSGITGEPPVVFANHGAWSTRRVGVAAPSATPAINTDKYDQVNMYSLAAAVTSMSTNLTGTPRDGQELTLILNDSGSPHAITWGSKFVGNLLATTAGSGKLHTQELRYDAVAAKWAGTYVDATGY